MMTTRNRLRCLALSLLVCAMVALPACNGEHDHNHSHDHDQAHVHEHEHDQDHEHEDRQAHQHDDGEEHANDHEHASHSLTIWDEAFEAFVSFEPHGSRVEGILYLSTPDNQPLPAGEIRLSLLDAAGNEQDTEGLRPARDGLFHFELHHEGIDAFYFQGTLQSEGTRLAFETDTFSSDEAHDEDTIRMPKEQQWLLNVASTRAVIRPVFASFSAPGQVRVDQQYLAEISAPVAGHLDGGAGGGLPVSSGDDVARGQRLATLAPSFQLENTGVERELTLLQAEQDYARAQRLREDNAISLREYELRKREYEAQQAVFDHFVGEDESTGTSLVRFNDHMLELLSPFDGVVGNVEAALGRTLEVGDAILTLYDPRRLWIDFAAYPEEVHQLEMIRGISWRSGRSAEWEHLSDDAITRVSTSGSASEDGLRRILHVRLTDGENGLFPGQRISARIYHGASEGVLAVPESAVFDHDTHRVVFVQHEGDRFEERVVETGNSYNGWVEIRSGLEAGDRVVSAGAYAVHLTTRNVQVDHGHDH